MWIPKVYRQEDLGALHTLIEEHGFAALVSGGEQGLFASHLPLLLDRERGPLGTLVGHMARANPHWQRLGAEVLVIFQGPHAYVTPAWYRNQVTVPTWNYAVVHAYGPAVVIHDPARLRQMVERLTRRHEGRQHGGEPGAWRLEQAAPIIEAELRGIVGFEIPIARLEGKLKLSQNRAREDQQGVVAALQGSADPARRELAALMQRNLDRRATEERAAERAPVPEPVPGPGGPVPGGG